MRQVKEYARDLRHNLTDAEKKLWQRLRMKKMGVKFRRQVPIDSYIADFVCFEKRLIVELDGGQHSKEVDAARTSYLESKGFIVLRFWNNDVMSNVEGVLMDIQEALDTPT